MIDTTMLLIMGCCVCCALSIAFTFYAYFNPDHVPFMQPFFDMFRNKDDEDEEADGGGVSVAEVPTPPPPTCAITQAELAAWKAECNQNEQCVTQRQVRKCGPSRAVFTQ